MRRHAREELASAEIMDTPIVISPQEREAARRVIAAHANSEDDLSFLLDSLDLR